MINIDKRSGPLEEFDEDEAIQDDIEASAQEAMEGQRE